MVSVLINVYDLSLAYQTNITNLSFSFLKEIFQVVKTLSETMASSLMSCLVNLWFIFYESSYLIILMKFEWSTCALMTGNIYYSPLTEECTCWVQGADSIKRYYLTSIGTPVVKIRRSHDRLICTMGFSMLVRWHLYVESWPWFLE